MIPLCLCCEETAPHPFFASRRQNLRPAGSFCYRIYSDVWGCVCSAAVPGAGPGLEGAREHPVSSAASAGLATAFQFMRWSARHTRVGDTLLCSALGSSAPARSLHTGERSGGCRAPAVKVAVCCRAGWRGARRRQETGRYRDLTRDGDRRQLVFALRRATDDVTRVRRMCAADYIESSSAHPKQRWPQREESHY